jgi:hypothetical protein
MRKRGLLWAAGLVGLLAPGCAKGEAAEGQASGPAQAGQAAANACKEGDFRHQEIGFCLTAPAGAEATPVLTVQGPVSATRSTMVSEPNKSGVEIKRFKGSLESETVGLDNVSKFGGNKELERGKLPGDKGVYVVADEEGCCVRITSVLQVGEDVILCMATADRDAKERPHLDVCKTLRAL